MNIEEAKHVLSMHLGDRVKKLRIESGLTQKELSIKAETSQSSISLMESNKFKGVTMNTLIKLAAALRANLVLDLKK